ncbi:hypothetical protein [Psychromicrobium xiongbiense]|uniref:hypothetical protein n=1 Tax=Psychromicrobium xiongbiense TaxID=3051184 RepID=UPI002553B40D|nr:hypothetical protein [Psychromicrobium sp. YIM S02556]
MTELIAARAAAKPEWDVRRRRELYSLVSTLIVVNIFSIERLIRWVWNPALSTGLPVDLLYLWILALAAVLSLIIFSGILWFTLRKPALDQEQRRSLHCTFGWSVALGVIGSTAPVWLLIWALVTGHH